MAAYEKGVTEEAVTHLEHTISLDAESTVGHFYLALSYDAMCEAGPNCDPHWSGLAIQQYNKVLDLDPSHIEALESLGSLLYKLLRFDEAEGLYRRASKLDANNAEALYAIAVFDWIRTHEKVRQERLHFNLGQKHH
jgi:tetratricopeptide (TPR) repeat protein